MANVLVVRSVSLSIFRITILVNLPTNDESSPGIFRIFQGKKFADVALLVGINCKHGGSQMQGKVCTQCWSGS